MSKPATMAVIKPAPASAPLLTPKAKASGKATAATVKPASISLTNFCELYPLNSLFNLKT